MTRASMLDPPTAVDLLLTPADVARILKKNPSFVRQEILSGRLRGLRIGIEWRVRGRDLDAYLEARASAEKSNLRDGRRRGQKPGRRPAGQ